LHVSWFRRTSKAGATADSGRERARVWAERADAAFDAATAGDLAGMRAAADAYRRSIALTPVDDPAFGERTINLAVSLSTVGRQAGDVAALDEAIGHFEAVLATTLADDERMPVRRYGIAVALTARGHRCADPADLARADATVALIPVASRYRASAHYLIADEWLAQFGRSNAVADLDRAIEEYRLSVVTSAPMDARVGGRRARYATLLADRAVALNCETQQATAITQLRLARDGLIEGEIRDSVNLTLGRLLLRRATRLDDSELDEGIAAAALPAVAGVVSEAELVAFAISVSRRLRLRAAEAASSPDGGFDPFYVRAIEVLERRRATATGDARIELVAELAAVHTARSDYGRDEIALTVAIELLRDQLDQCGTVPGRPGSDLYRQLASVLARHAERFGAMASLDAAVRHGETAVSLATTDDALIDALDTLGWAQVLAALAKADYDRLDVIYESCFDRAITLSGGAASARPGLLANAAIALRESGARRFDQAKLDQAITLLRAAISAEPEPAALTNLANALGDRYGLDGDLSVLDEAIEVARRAVAGTARADGYRASRLANLGHRLVDRYQAAGRVRDLDEAISNYVQAVAEEDPHAAAAANHVAALATAVRYRFWATGDRRDLRMACRCDTDAVNRTPSAASERPRRLAGLAASLVARWEVEHNPADLDDAIEALGNALALADEEDAARVNWAARLGDAYAWRSRRGDDEDARMALQWFAHSLETAERRQGEYTSALDAALYWQSWAVRRACWAEAAEAGHRGLQFARQIDRQQMTRADRETRLSLVGALAATTAHALVKMASNEAAVLTLESARAVLLSDALGLDETRLQAVEVSAPELAAAYRAAEERLRPLTRPAPPGEAVTETDRAHARSARADLDAAVAAIRRITGYEHFRAEPTMSDIAEAADSPVVYLVPARSGGMALIVTGSEVADIALPELSRDDLRRRSGDYYSTFVAARGESEQRVAWQHTLDDITAWLWDAAMGPVAAHFPKRSRISLVPVGRLGVLPLHVAWVPDADRPTGRRYALDELTISYAPNARSLAAARRTAAAVPMMRAVAIVEPRPVPAGPLPGAHFEALAMSAGAPVELTTVSGGAATRRRLLRESAAAGVLHLACHAYADPRAPLDSGLLLADGLLRLRDLLGAGRIESRLAVLSACESGVFDGRIPDESVALSTALLQAGVAGVIATQWSVPDRAAAMLMAEFYHRWGWGTCPIPEALRTSQQWLRDTTNAEKRRIWTARAAQGILLGEVAEFFADTMLGLEPGEREHAHVQSWGAFTYSGA
jgi:CHAT domain-containing protein/tetratricopeptide (TPR) repeat protein